MANPETRFCTNEEYNQGRRERVFVGDLAFDGLYKMMVLISQQTMPPHNRAEAVEALTRLTDVEPVGDGIHLVEFALLDLDQIPRDTYTKAFRDGYLLACKGPNFIEKGYFRDYQHSSAAPALEAAATSGANLPADATVDQLVETYMP